MSAKLPRRKANLFQPGLRFLMAGAKFLLGFPGPRWRSSRHGTADDGNLLIRRHGSDNHVSQHRGRVRAIVDLRLFGGAFERSMSGMSFIPHPGMKKCLLGRCQWEPRVHRDNSPAVLLCLVAEIDRALPILRGSWRRALRRIAFCPQGRLSNSALAANQDRRR